MLILIISIGLVLLGVGTWLYIIQERNSCPSTRWEKFKNAMYECDVVNGVLIMLGTIICIISITASIIVGVKCSQEKAIDAKLQIYQEENIAIEETVAQLVNDYQEYEQETFKSFKPEDIMVAINLYPELKSDELVNKQLDIHEENNKKIKSLKSEKANLTTYKWWLYFGE